MKLQAVDQSGQSQPIEIDLSRKIGEGATATVYRVIFQNELWAAKIYKPERAYSVEKLEAMLQSPPDELAVNEDGQTFIRYTWVKNLLKDNTGKVVGFLMPFVDQRSTNSLDTYYDPVLIKRLPGKINAALSLRLEIAKNLCELIDNLHKVGHFFIDIKPQNIRVYRDNNKVVLMDCDGYSIKNPQRYPDRFPADLISTDYIAPEVLKNHLSPKSLGEEQDRYGLAVLLFQLLNRGTHPFQGVVTDPSIQVSTNDERAALGLYPYGLSPHASVRPRPQSIHTLLPDSIRALFDKAFISLDRPTASQWLEHFESILENKQLVRCKDHPSEITHIHFAGKNCIGCKIDEIDKDKVKPAPRKYKTSATEAIDNNSNIASSSSSSSSVSGPSYQSIMTPKSQNSDMVLFAAVLIVIGFFVLVISLNSTSSNTTSSSSSSVSTTSQNCADLIRSSNYSQLCTTYWSNYNSCGREIEKYFISEDRRYSPLGLCGAANPKTEPFSARVARYQKEMMAGSLKTVPTNAQVASTSPGYVNNDNRLPGQLPVIEASAAQSLELYQTWWYTEAKDYLYIRLENTTSASISSIKISIFDHCSSNRKIINSFLLTPEKSLGRMEVGVFKTPFPLPTMQKTDAFRCLDVEMVFTRDKIQDYQPNNQASQPPSTPTHDASIGFGAIYFDNFSNEFSWSIGHRTLNEAKNAARKSCQERSGPSSQCSHGYSGNYRCVAISQSSVGRFSYMANSLNEARRTVEAACKKASGSEVCLEPYEGSKCID